MNSDIKIGSTVRLLYWRDKEVHDFVVTDIFFEGHMISYKTMIKAKYYSKKSDRWFIETYFIVDFFDAMHKANKADKEAKNELCKKDETKRLK